MSAPLRNIFSRTSQDDSWFTRVSENFHQLMTARPLRVHSANGAPLHLLHPGKNRSGSAQACSVAAHSAAVLLLLYLGATQIPAGVTQHPGEKASVHPIPSLSPSTIAKLFGHPSPGTKGGSSDQNSIPATRGNLAPRSPIQLLAPRLPQNPKPILPVPETIFDAQAPTQFTVVTNLGLPWMPSITDSGGPGKNHGIGVGPGHGMGDNDGNDEGYGKDGTYANVVSWPVCTYCPDPTYSDEARQAKVQGTVTLRVLVAPDGRASQIQILKGLGFDLDERAAKTVRTWRFLPARDVARRSVPIWMTVEVTYRLF